MHKHQFNYIIHAFPIFTIPKIAEVLPFRNYGRTSLLSGSNPEHHLLTFTEKQEERFDSPYGPSTSSPLD